MVHDQKQRSAQKYIDAVVIVAQELGWPQVDIEPDQSKLPRPTRRSPSQGDLRDHGLISATTSVTGSSAIQK